MVLQSTQSSQFVFVHKFDDVDDIRVVDMLYKDGFMKGVTAIYNGRVIDKKYFRAFIHACDGQKRLVESWEEYEANVQTGCWFATEKDAKDALAMKEVAIAQKEMEEKEAKKARKPRVSKKEQESIVEANEEFSAKESENEEMSEDCSSIDDFLPNASA